MNTHGVGWVTTVGRDWSRGRRHAAVAAVAVAFAGIAAWAVAATRRLPAWDRQIEGTRAITVPLVPLPGPGESPIRQPEHPLPTRTNDTPIRTRDTPTPGRNEPIPINDGRRAGVRGFSITASRVDLARLLAFDRNGKVIGESRA